MRKPLRRALFVAALVAGGTLPSLGANPPTGIVSGPEEQAIINAIQACVDLEEEAYAIALPLEDQKIVPPTDTQIAGYLMNAIECLHNAQDAIIGGNSFQDSTDTIRALKALNAALQTDEEVIRDLEDLVISGYGVTNQLNRAFYQKHSAQYFLQGIRTTRKDAAALAANPGPPDYDCDCDLKAWRSFPKLTAEDLANGTGDSENGICKATKEALPPDLYGPYQTASTIKTTKAPRNYYFAYQGTTANPGFIFKSLGRPMFGPFETRFQVGAFDPTATVDTGSACVEFDLQGSSPLQFFAVCGRRIDGGVQVFAQSHLGPAGNLFLPGATIAQVRVNYSGTQFTCSAAAGKGAPDFILSPFATFDLTQGSTALVPGIGASGLTKGAVIGLDEIYFTPK